MRNKTIVSIPLLLQRLLVSATFLLLLASCTKEAAAPPHEPELMARLSFTRNHVIIDNGNDYVWTKVTIRLNDSYQYTTELLPRGSSSLPLNEFRDATGNAFDPKRMTPHRLTMQVQDGFNGKPGYFEW